MKKMKFAMDMGVTSDKPFDMMMWAMTELGNRDNFIYGRDLDSFVSYCNSTGNHKIYCNNLNKNGKILIRLLYMNDYEYISFKSNAKEKTFTSWIDDKGNIYSIDIYMSKTRRIAIVDSSKLVNETPKKIISDFDIQGVKYYDFNFDLLKNGNYYRMEKAVECLKNNTIAIAEVLDYMFSLGLTKNTMASNAIHEYINTIGEKNFKKFFPALPYEVDYDIRMSYKGGYIYTSPEYKGNESSINVDINSMYPNIMLTKPLPYGVPLKFEGKYPENSLYPLYVQNIKCNFELKENHLPTIQVKNSKNFNGTEYLKNSNGEDVILCLTSVDLELFFINYYVYNIEYMGGYMFKASTNLFKDYMNKWGRLKEDSKKENEILKSKLAKLMMNSLYGKFSISPNIQRKNPVLYDKRVVLRKLDDYYKAFNINKVFIPLGTFITAYGRKRMTQIGECIKYKNIYIDNITL